MKNNVDCIQPGSGIKLAEEAKLILICFCMNMEATQYFKNIVFLYFNNYNIYSGAKLPQESVDVSQAPTVPLEKKLEADKAVLDKHVMKFPTTESVCVTKQQLFAVILVVEVIPDPISVSINAHILPMEESVLVCRFLLSDASAEVAATTAPTESMLASSSVTETVFKQYNDYQKSEIHSHIPLNMIIK